MMRLLEVAVHNSFLLYRKAKQGNGGPKSYLDYKKSVILSLVSHMRIRKNILSSESKS